jgi:hypothetical protein
MRTRLLVLPFTGILLLAAIAAPASAHGGEVRGSCSGGPSEYRLRVRQGDGDSLRVRFEIESEGAGERWQVFLSDNGTRIYARTRLSDGDGWIRVRKATEDRDGADRISASGVNLETGESCAGSVSF